MRMMILAGAAMMIAACDHPELHVDVTRINGYINVEAVEVGRPGACGAGFVHPGACDSFSDVASCGSGDPDLPASWLGELRLEGGGQVLALAPYEAPYGGALVDTFAGRTDLVLHIDNDGEDIAIPLPDVAPPVATLTAVERVGTEAHVTWSATPAAASVLSSLGDGFVGSTCHGAPVSPLVLPAGDASAELAVFVETYAAPTVTTTALGTVELWTGSRTARVPVGGSAAR